ncbi:Phosphinothricin N-acetyltransferase [Acidisarcina polymorpha]|uniref:Phosphinothricin N-acetyltransferase n=2 Tax=Acidisarcina polymorpha TaxID=2211140 RepID=A0A2Z5FZF0_9BACT|nr:Phosphinothricin N-acetyltransferase [Acidisarcina polymorpha]
MAEDEDIPAVTEIYNELLRTSTAIYRDEAASIDERVLWWQSQQQKGYPLFIAEEDDQVLGFASYGDFRPWPDYRFTVEGSIHSRRVAKDVRRAAQNKNPIARRERDALSFNLQPTTSARNSMEVSGVRKVELNAPRCAQLQPGRTLQSSSVKCAVTLPKHPLIPPIRTSEP